MTKWIAIPARHAAVNGYRMKWEKGLPYIYFSRPLQRWLLERMPTGTPCVQLLQDAENPRRISIRPCRDSTPGRLRMNDQGISKHRLSNIAQSGDLEVKLDVRNSMAIAEIPQIRDKSL